MSSRTPAVAPPSRSGVSISGPLGGVAGALNKLSYGTKLSALASEAARGR